MDAAAAIACPVLIISGNRDMMTNPKAAARLAAALRDVRTVSLEGAGHVISEQPDAMLDTLRSFIAA
jgi:pimeloyl-ACP methyl ester carboxylesterase